MATDNRQFLALAALGPDRPGLVADATRFVAERGGNVEDSRMAILGAEFGILLLVSAPDAATGKIESELPELSKVTGLEFQVRRTRSPEDHRREAGIPCVVTAEALDHEGIVQAVSGALHKVGVNIVSLSTEAYEAPITGSPLFRMDARIDIPPGRTVSDIRQALDVVAAKENLDIEARTLTARS
ncbi:MAG: transcriptional regulator [Candidatus Sericytochromatia bacterium]|uniref:Transcriptional regulator n=1 Tax=Candidatus Tanganyikabacteria bacterium TaxID=2961651 RepID=A0A938BMW5_9BACT|nr:transcriptional regulator [Candidatus Tanganyikabacteria bacterium]